MTYKIYHSINYGIRKHTDHWPTTNSISFLIKLCTCSQKQNSMTSTGNESCFTFFVKLHLQLGKCATGVVKWTSVRQIQPAVASCNQYYAVAIAQCSAVQCITRLSWLQHQQHTTIYSTCCCHYANTSHSMSMQQAPNNKLLHTLFSFLGSNSTQRRLTSTATKCDYIITPRVTAAILEYNSALH